MKSIRFDSLLLVTLVGLLVAAGALAQAPVDPPGAPIRLRMATFTPTRGEAPAIPPGLAIAGYAEGERGYYLVQFRGPVLDTWKAGVQALGAELLAYVPEFAYKVRMTPAQARQLERLEGVAWVGLFQPAYKLSPRLARDGRRLYAVVVEPGADGEGVAAAVGRMAGVTVLSREGNLLVVAAEGAHVDAVARVLDVAWIENYALRKKHNEYGAGVILGANAANANGYDGSTQTVAVSDTGLGGGTSGSAHPDVPSGRIAAIHNWPGANSALCYNVVDDGAVDVDSGHGTHVSLSAVGDGGAGGEGKGTAPAARLLFQAVENWADMIGFCAAIYPDGYYLVGIPTDIRGLFNQAYTGGARIHSNSWGSDAAGDYTVDSANADDFVWSNRDIAITFSAGNAGTDGNADGAVDLGSVGSPATAKNVISVGASENHRQGSYPCDTGLAYTGCAAQGGQNSIFTYGAAWPADFPAAPLSSDPSAGNAEQLAAFSSRGPTSDGRIKPDVVAPGTWVLSGYSDLYQQGYDSQRNPRNNAWQYDGWGYPLNPAYKYMGGTSMSNPLVAGAAAVVRDFYQKARSHSASAALVKATLINSAVDLLDENNDGVGDNDFPIPNPHEGWGRVNLQGATSSQRQFVDDAAGIQTNGVASSSYTAAGGAPMKVTLVWSDYPSTEAAAINLVNDLDLVVTSPGGTVYRGNVFSAGWSAPGGSADRINNVENVYVQSAAAGTWTVEVRGFNVPNGPQPFALVVDGASTTPPPPNTPPTASFTSSCSGLGCNFDASGSTDTDGTIVSYAWDFGDGSSGAGAATSHNYAASGSYTVVLTVTDDDGATDTDTQTVNVTAPPSDSTMHIGDLDGSSAAVRRNTWAATVTIVVHDGNHNPLAGATVAGTWSGGYSGTSTCTTGAAGQCSVTSGNISTKKSSTTFAVTNVTMASKTYAGGNHDPDGSSDGTRITVNRP